MINIFVMFQFSQSSVPSVSVSPLDHGTYASEKRNVRMYIFEGVAELWIHGGH